MRGALMRRAWMRGVPCAPVALMIHYVTVDARGGGRFVAARQQHDASPAQRVPDGRSTRWTAHRAARREQLIDAALAVLEEAGPDFGLQQVASRAGVTKPVIYRHFGERAALVEAMGDRATDLLMARLMPALFAESALLTRIRLTIEAFLGFIDESPKMYRFFARRAPLDGRDLAGVDKEFVAEALTSVLREYLRPFDPAGDRIAPVWARGIVGFVPERGGVVARVASDGQGRARRASDDAGLGADRRRRPPARRRPRPGPAGHRRRHRRPAPARRLSSRSGSPR